MATGLAAEMCRRKGLQFLDGTVALARMGLRRTPGGLRIRRLYRFEYSEEGMGRHTGHVLMVGPAVEELSFGLPGDAAAQAEDEQSPSPGTGAHDSSRILPFRRRGP